MIKKLKRLDTAADAIRLLPDLFKAVPRKDYARIAVDLADFAGLKSCIQGLANAVA